MASPNYTHDLNDLATGDESTGWAEFGGSASAGSWTNESFSSQGLPAYQDPDYPYIQGSFSVTQDCTKDTSIGSLVYNTTAVDHGTDGAFFVWHNYMVASNVGPYSDGGYQVLLATDTNNFKSFFTGGSDTLPYGGWVNHVANSTVTAEATVGTLGNITQVGSAVWVVQGSSKGEVHNADAIRYGRGSSIFELGDVTTPCTFEGYATQNDSNTNRWGLVSATSGGYLWKGRMSIGNATNAAYMVDASTNIFIDWTPKVTANFNTVEIQNASTFLDLNGVSFLCLNNTSASRGKWINTDNATVNLTGCTFTDMESFVFQSGTTIKNCSFLSPGYSTTGGTAFTTGGATISDTVFTYINSLNLTSTLTGGSVSNSTQIDISSTGGLSGVTINETLDTTVDGVGAQVKWNGSQTLEFCKFNNSVGGKHAIELSTVPASITWNSTFNANDYTAGASQTGTYTPTTANDAVIYISATSSQNLTINSAGYSAPSVKVNAGYTGTITVNLAANPIITVKVYENDGSTPLTNAVVYLVDSSSNDVIAPVLSGTGTVSGTNSFGTSTATLRVRKYGWKPYEATVTIDATNTINVQMSVDAQAQVSPTALNNAGTITVNDTGKTVNINGTNVPTHTTYATMDKTIELYRFLQNYFASTAKIIYQHGMNSATSTDFSFTNGWDFAQPTIDYKYLYGGSIKNEGTNRQWSNVTSVGTLEANTEIYAVQGLSPASSSKLTTWWPDGYIDILVEVHNGTSFIQSYNGSATAIDGGVWFFAREYGDLYGSFFADLSGGGRTVIPMTTSADRNNETLSSTVSTYNIGFTWGQITRNLGGSDTDGTYEVEINLNGHTLLEFYEYTKFATSLANSITLDGYNGFEYRNADMTNSVTPFTDNVQSPFGTFAGGRFFGAQGVYITGMATSDNVNYELSDIDGNPHTPPVTYTLELTGLKDGTEVNIRRTSDDVLIASVEDITNGVGTFITDSTGQSNTTENGTVSVSGTTNDNTFSYQYTYGTDSSFYAVVMNFKYQHFVLSGQTLSNSNQSIPISQVIDRNYLNG